MSNYPADKFTLFSNCNQDREVEGKYWAIAEWPLSQIEAFYRWATTEARTVQNQRGEECVVVKQNLLPKQSQAGNDYLMSVISDPKPKKESVNPNIPF